MIVSRDEIKEDGMYSGSDFLETLNSVLSDLEREHENFKDAEKLYHEAGANNKALLEKTIPELQEKIEMHKKTIDSLTDRNATLIEDREHYIKALKMCEDSLKKASFLTANKVPQDKVLPFYLQENLPQIMQAMNQNRSALLLAVGDQRMLLVGFQ